MTSLVLANYRRGEEAFALQRAAHKLAQDLRQAAEMAIAGKEYGGSFPPGGYGIYFSLTDSTYILFADLDGNKLYDSGEDVKSLSLQERGVRISNISPGPSLSIVFFPPDPTVFINNGASSQADITLEQKGETKTITINRVGLIDID